MASIDSIDKFSFSESVVNSMEIPKIEIMLISDSEELKKLLYFVLSSSNDVKYYTVDELNDDELALICEMDIVIFNKNDKKLKNSVISMIQNNNMPVTFFEISNERYVRQKDILKAHNIGIDRLFKKNFQFEEFIIAIEMHLRNNFYTKRLLALKPRKNILTSKRDYFNKRIESLLNKKIFFSLLTFNYEADIDIEEYNIKKVLREDDMIFIDKNRKIIEFLVLNITPNFARELIRKRIRNFSITLNELESYSAFEIVYKG